MGNEENEWTAVQLRMRDRCAEIAARENVYGDIGPVIAERIRQITPEKFEGKEFPPHTRHRKTDPDTSQDAAYSLKDVRESQRLVLDVIKECGPLCDRDIYTCLELNHDAVEGDGHVMSTSGARTRRSELVEMGFVKDSGKRALTPGGGNTILWMETSGKRLEEVEP
ncbi:MAG: hypothetical protein V3V91_08960 [Thermoplasmata archaeon]